MIEDVYVYAYVHVTMADGVQHKFAMKNNTELGSTLNHVQGEIWNEKVVECHVEPIDKRAYQKATAFNKVGGTLERQKEVSRIIRGVDDKNIS